jgi:hypothetical protein
LGAAQVREDLPDDRGIVQRGDQPQPAPAVRANGEHDYRIGPTGHILPTRADNPNPPNPLEYTLPSTALEWDFGRRIPAANITSPDAHDPLLAHVPAPVVDADGMLDDDGGSMCLDGEPFTGIECWVDEKEGRGETTYIHGTQTGLKRGWYPSGAPKYEYWMLMGTQHGKKREWHPNGQLAEEADYELGFDLRHKFWDKDGNLIEEFERDKNDPAYEQLKSERETYKEEIGGRT